MQMHLDQMQMHLDKMQQLFYNNIFAGVSLFLRATSDSLLNYLVTANNKKKT